MAARVLPRTLSRLALRRAAARRTFATTPSKAAEQIRIVEVGPRDGLQNEKQSIPLKTKIELIERLAGTGLQTIEAASFVSPKWVPQMASSSEVLKHTLSTPPKAPHPITYQFLLPNERGLDNFLKVFENRSSQPNNAPHGYPTPPPSPGPDSGPALNTSSQDPNAMPSASSGAEAMSQPLSTSSTTSSTPQPEIELSIFTAATESFTRKNTNCSIAESLDRFKPIMTRAKTANLKVRAYISVALGCPYEGPNTDPHKVAELAVSLLEMGSDEISVADTTGMGTAPGTRALLRILFAAGLKAEDLALHFHDTYGQALVNTLISLENGIRTFDSAVGGLGGCPYSPGATGNVATEDLVRLVHSLGAETGVDLEKMAEIGDWISRELGKANESRAGKAILASMRARDV